MSLWRVSNARRIVVMRWSLILTDLAEVHVVGYNVAESEGRVSSALASLDTVARTALTRRGKTYVLDGETGYDGDAHYVLDAWLGINKVATWRDVSAEVLAVGLDEVVARAMGACSL